jgi:hypothetical protein
MRRRTTGLSSHMFPLDPEVMSASSNSVYGATYKILGHCANVLYIVFLIVAVSCTYRYSHLAMCQADRKMGAEKTSSLERTNIWRVCYLKTITFSRNILLQLLGCGYCRVID